MRRSSLLTIALLALLLAAATACTNPATGKPEAVVTDAEPIPDAAPAAGERYVLGPDSTIGFVGSKVTGSHNGGFNVFSGEINLVGGDPTASSFEFVIDTTSLWVDNDRLAGHLKSPDFFEVETFPTATFTSTAITAAEDGYLVTGNLDLHGVSRSISFPAQITVAEGQVIAEAEFFIKRFDFGIVYEGRADDLIRDEVVIKLQLVAVLAEIEEA